MFSLLKVFFEPTDHACSRKPFQTQNWKDVIKFITPNVNELRVIAAHLGADPPTASTGGNFATVVNLAKFIATHVQNVIVTMGKDGVLIANRNHASDLLMIESSKIKRTEINVRHYPALRCDDLINVSGAGDCLAAGIITAMLEGKSEEICVNVGMHSALRALRSQCAIPEVLNLCTNCWVEVAKHNKL